MTANQFAMYGIPNVPADTVNQYAEQMLNNEKELNRVYEKCEEDKVLDYVKSVITADVKDVTRDEMAIINDNAAPKAEKPAKKAPAKKTAAKKAVKDEAAEEEAPKAEKPARKRTAKAKKEE